MDIKDLKELKEIQYLENEKWYSWGTPIGISIFFVSIALIILLIRLAFVIK